VDVPVRLTGGCFFEVNVSDVSVDWSCASGWTGGLVAPSQLLLVSLGPPTPPLDHVFVEFLTFIGTTPASGDGAIKIIARNEI